LVDGHDPLIMSYHIIDGKRQNCLKVGADKPKLKVKMQSVSDDDVWKRLVEKPLTWQWTLFEPTSPTWL